MGAGVFVTVRLGVGVDVGVEVLGLASAVDATRVIPRCIALRVDVGKCVGSEGGVLGPVEGTGARMLELQEASRMIESTVADGTKE